MKRVRAIVLSLLVIASSIIVYDWQYQRRVRLNYSLFLDDEYCINKFIEKTGKDGFVYWNVTVGPVHIGRDSYSEGKLIRTFSANTYYQGRVIFYPYAGTITEELKIYYSRLD